MGRVDIVNANLIVVNDLLATRGLCAPEERHATNFRREYEIKDRVKAALKGSGEIVEAGVGFGRANMEIVQSEPVGGVEVQELAGEDQQALNQDAEFLIQHAMRTASLNHVSAQLDQSSYRQDVQHEHTPYTHQQHEDVDVVEGEEEAVVVAVGLVEPDDTDEAKVVQQRRYYRPYPRYHYAVLCHSPL